MNLALLNQAYNQFLEQIENAQGEIADETALEEVQRALVAKVDHVAWVLDKLDADAAFYTEQADKLYNAAQSLKRAHERLRSFVYSVVQQTQDKRLEGETVAFGVKKSPPALRITDESLIPDRFRVLTPSIDKPALKKALAQESIPGASLVQGESLLRTRPKK